MNIREKLVDNRLKLAMQPVVQERVFPVTFNWRIGAIMEKSKWDLLDDPDEFYFDFIDDFVDFLMLGKWSEQ